MKHLFLLLFTTSVWAQEQYITKAELLSDIDYATSALEESHFNLYAYSSKVDFQNNVTNIEGEINSDSISMFEAHRYLQRIVAGANNAHTRIEFPASFYFNYAENGGTVFPLELAFEAGKVYVRKNLSKTDIAVGSEITKIDNRPISEILQGIYPLISGEDLAMKNAQLEALSFPRYYWWAYGSKKEFEVTINGQSITLQSITAMEDFEYTREDFMFNEPLFKYYDKTAYLRPGGFGGDQKYYESFIDSSFADIKKSSTQRLILDLRNNPGGDDSFSNYLVSYIADRPFKWNAKFELKNSSFLKEHVRKHMDTTSVYWQTILEKGDEEVFEYQFEDYEPQAEHKRFKGEVIVLVNRQSYSQSTVTAAQLQDYGWALIVGEETAEYANLFASLFSFKTPNSEIEIKVAKGYMERLSGDKSPKGVQPDILIKDHLLDEEDEILNRTLESSMEVSVEFNKNLEYFGYLIELGDPSIQNTNHPISKIILQFPENKKSPALYEIFSLASSMDYATIIQLMYRLPEFPQEENYPYESYPELLKKLNQFYIDSNFEKIWQELQPYRESTVQQIEQVKPSKTLMDKIEAYYGSSFKEYCIIPSLTIWSGAAWGMMDQSREKDLFVLGPLSKNQNFTTFAVHEFGHPFSNPVVLSNKNLIKATESLFEPSKQAMSEQGYPTWASCLTEYFVRAGEIIILPEDQSQNLMKDYMETRKFIYLDFVVDRMKKYRFDQKLSYAEAVKSTLEEMENTFLYF